MINRELIRLKVVQLVYANTQNPGKAIDVAEKELMFSLGKAYELYEYLLTFLVLMRELAQRKAAAVAARNERLGLKIDGISADACFANNKLLAQLAANEALIDYRENVKATWLDEDAFVKKIYAAFTDNEVWQLYLSREDFSYEADREVVRKLYKTCICENEDFDAYLEEHGLYWNDDKEIVDSFVLKTIKRFTADTKPNQALLPEFDSDDDRRFAVALFRATLTRGSELCDLIRSNCKNWEFKRLALMDVVIAEIALAEILTFPDIPLGVTFNEYLDLARLYSTPRSPGYLNGLLNGIVRQLKAEGHLLKTITDKPHHSAAGH